MTSNKKDKLFLLGSGFSKAVANIPTLLEISKEIKSELKKLSNPVWVFLLNIPSIFYTNIEEFLSYLMMDLPWSKATDFHLRKAAFLELQQLFADLISKYEKEGKDKIEKNNDFRQLVELWHHWETDVITFNYDTLVERVVKDLKRKTVIRNNLFSRDESYRSYKVLFQRVPEFSACPLFEEDNKKEIFYWRIRSGFFNLINYKTFQDWHSGFKKDESFSSLSSKLRQDISNTFHNEVSELNSDIKLTHVYQIPLTPRLENGTNQLSSHYYNKDYLTFRYYKLHGSTNWYYTGLQEVSDETIYYDPTNLERQIEGLNPLIIPPVLDKNSFYKNFSLAVQWQKALEALQNKDLEEIYIIGYSLPPTDMVVRNFLRMGLWQSKDKRTLKIFFLSLFKNDEEKKEFLLNYCRALIGVSDSNQKKLRNILEQNKTEWSPKEGLTFDWSLSIEDKEIKTNDKDDSCIKKLVDHLKKESSLP